MFRLQISKALFLFLAPLALWPRSADGWPCPNGGDISPCRCLTSPEGITIIDLWCSNVPDDAKLSTVFQANFPYIHYRSIHLDESPGVTALPDGIFADLTFKEIHVVRSGVGSVTTGALSASHEQAELMNVYYNDITAFPFDDLASFTSLKELRLYGNQLTTFPSFSSDYLEVFSLGYNPLGPVPDVAFQSTPAMREIHLYGAGLNDILPGTFTGMANLEVLSLRDNQLTSLTEGSISMTSGGRAYLQNNTISSVAPNAISGLSGGLIDLHDNQLTTLEEMVWRPLLEAGVTLDLRGNPLTCGCDLAWVFSGSGSTTTLLDLIDRDSTCQDGQLVMELDPSVFQDC